MSVYCTTCGNQVSLTAGHTCYQKELNVLLCEIPSHAKLEARIAQLEKILAVAEGALNRIDSLYKDVQVYDPTSVTETLAYIAKMKERAVSER